MMSWLQFGFCDSEIADEPLQGRESIVPCCRAPWIVTALTTPAFTASCAPVEEPSTVSNPDAVTPPFHRWASRLFRGWSRDLKIAKGLLAKSNNSRKSRAVFNAGIKVAARIPCEVAPNSHSLAYLRTK